MLPSLPCIVERYRQLSPPAQSSIIRTPSIAVDNLLRRQQGTGARLDTPWAAMGDSAPSLAAWFDSAPLGSAMEPRPSANFDPLESSRALSPTPEPGPGLAVSTTAHLADHSARIREELCTAVDEERREQLEKRQTGIAELLQRVKALDVARNKLGMYPVTASDIFEDTPIRFEPEVSDCGSLCDAKEAFGDPPVLLLPDLPDNHQPRFNHPSLSTSDQLLKEEADEALKKAAAKGVPIAGVGNGDATGSLDAEAETVFASRVHNSDMAHIPFGRLMASFKCLDAHVGAVQSHMEAYSMRVPDAAEFRKEVDDDLEALLFLQRALAVTARHAVGVLEVGCQRLALDFIRFSCYNPADVFLSYLRDDLLEYPFFIGRCAQLVSSAETALERMQAVPSVAFEHTQAFFAIKCDSTMQTKTKEPFEIVRKAVSEEFAAAERSLMEAYRSKSIISQHGEALFCAERSAIALRDVRGYKFDRTLSRLEIARNTLSWTCRSVHERALEVQKEYIEDCARGERCRSEKREPFLGIYRKVAALSEVRLGLISSRLALLKRGKDELHDGVFGESIGALDPILVTLAEVIVPCCTNDAKAGDVVVRDGDEIFAPRASETKSEKEVLLQARVPSLEYASSWDESASQAAGLHVSDLDNVLPSLEAVGGFAIRDVTIGLGLLFNDSYETSEKMAGSQLQAEKDKFAKEWAMESDGRNSRKEAGNAYDTSCSYCSKMYAPSGNLASDVMPCCSGFLCRSCGTGNVELTRLCILCKGRVEACNILNFRIRNQDAA